MINFLVDAEIIEACNNLGIMPIVKFVKLGIFPIIRIGIPMILLVLGTIDIGKAVLAGKEDEMKNAQKMFIKRLIYAALVFFIVPIISIVFGLFYNSDNEELVKAGEAMPNWSQCWEAAQKD